MIEDMFTLEQHFKRFTFNMPGWTMELHPMPYGVALSFGSFECARLLLRAKVRDTYNPDSTALVEVGHPNVIRLPLPVEALAHEIRKAIHRAMCHEADEWLREDGVIIFDPHQGDV